MVINFLVIALGGALGAMLRYAAGLMISSLSLGSTFPLATFIVNIAGSFIIGFFALSHESLLKTGLMIGFLGALTTYSSFSLESLRLLETGAQLQFFANILLTPLFALLACAAGLYLSKLIYQ